MIFQKNDQQILLLFSSVRIRQVFVDVNTTNLEGFPDVFKISRKRVKNRECLKPANKPSRFLRCDFRKSCGVTAQKSNR